MLKDWSEESVAEPFALSPNISSDNEMKAYQWSTQVNRQEIFHWFNNYYIVPSSESAMTTSNWLMLYRSGQWKSFDEFVSWQKSCWLVCPLLSCTCPVWLKQYTCKHSVGLGMIFGSYEVSDQARLQPLGKRKSKGRPKKVRTALFF